MVDVGLSGVQGSQGSVKLAQPLKVPHPQKKDDISALEMLEMCGSAWSLHENAAALPYLFSAHTSNNPIAYAPFRTEQLPFGLHAAPISGILQQKKHKSMLVVEHWG